MTPAARLPRPLPLLLLLALACNTLLPPAAQPPSAPTATAFRPLPATPTAPPASATPLPATPTPAVTPTRQPTSLQPEDVTFYPGPQLYSGDVVSLAILADNAEPDWQELPVRVYLGSRQDSPLGEARFGRFGIGGRAQATLPWVWDTAGLEGPQTLVIAVERGDSPGGTPLDVLDVTVDLRPASELPLPEPLARWAQVESDCCIFHYLTGTAAARDLALIREQADRALEQVTAALGVGLEEKLSITLLSRLLGHGGFAAEEISVTYMDRNPAGNNLSTVMAHEGTHALDHALAEVRPVMLTEGLAVYLAGGHFKPERLRPRARALLALERFIPLRELADDFYPSQHEIGYLEAGAFVDYLVTVHGWDGLRRLYREFRQADSDSQMLDRALRSVFGQGLDEIEAGWLAHLRAEPADPDEMEDLRLTVELYDTLRRYQLAYDPSAYFLTAWLPNGPEGRRRGIVADFVRHPNAPENIALEAMLAEARQALEGREFALASELLQAANAALEAGDLSADPLAAGYLEVVHALAGQGYEAQRIRLEGEWAAVQAIRIWPRLEALALQHTALGWQLAAGE